MKDPANLPYTYTGSTVYWGPQNAPAIQVGASFDFPSSGIETYYVEAELSTASTLAPTSLAPTKAPTTAPTSQAPTKAPTKAPTQAPTKAPTQAPSKAPTKAPTPAPTCASGSAGSTACQPCTHGKYAVAGSAHCLWHAECLCGAYRPCINHSYSVHSPGSSDCLPRTGNACPAGTTDCQPATCANLVLGLFVRLTRCAQSKHGCRCKSELGPACGWCQAQSD